MLLWEALAIPAQKISELVSAEPLNSHSRRLPYDHRCSALTKSGTRCRGRIVRKTSEWCLFHDPEIAAKRRAAMQSKPRRMRAKLSRLPDGYLKKLSNRPAVGNAMDRLYRELRLGLITPTMADVLFRILSRLLDSGLADKSGPPKAPHLSKAERLRPKLKELLTRSERTAWRKAVAEAPEQILQFRADFTKRDSAAGEAAAAPATKAIGHPASKSGSYRALQAAS